MGAAVPVDDARLGGAHQEVESPLLLERLLGLESSSRSWLPYHAGDRRRGAAITAPLRDALAAGVRSTTRR